MLKGLDGETDRVAQNPGRLLRLRLFVGAFEYLERVAAE